MTDDPIAKQLEEMREQTGRTRDEAIADDVEVPVETPATVEPIVEKPVAEEPDAREKASIEEPLEEETPVVKEEPKAEEEEGEAKDEDKDKDKDGDDKDAVAKDGDEVEGKEADEEDEGAGDKDDETGEEIDPLAMMEAAAKLDVTSAPASAAEKPKEVEKPVTAEPAGPAIDLIVSQEEWSSSFDNVDAFNKNIMGKVKQHLAGREQDLLRATMGTVMPAVSQAIEIRLAASDFYLANPDLAGAKTFVGKVANKIFADNPDKSIDECFNMTGEEVRRLAKIKKPASKASKVSSRKPGGKKPATVPKSSRKSRKPEPPVLTGMKKELADMQAVGNR